MAVGRAEIEAQLVKAGFSQRAEVFLCAQKAVGVHVLMDAGVCKFADHAVVFLDLHERLEVYIGDAGWLFLDGEQQIEIALIELRSADLPHALPDGRDAVELAVVIAEAALNIALVRLADGTKACAGQTGAAASGEFAFVADEKGASSEGFEPRDFAHQLFVARVDGVLDLGEDRQRDLLLMGQQLLLFGQHGKKLKPHQRVFF